jgi:hypothetical protein
MTVGRVVSVLGFALGGMVWVMLVALLFVRIPKQSRLLKVIGISCVIMAIASLLLFVGMAGCREYWCSPGAVYSAIPSFIFFAASGGLLIHFQRTSKLPLLAAAIETAL